MFIGGDSAGGNLALALMSHILHPHPQLEDDLRVNLSGPLAGAVLTSPWVKFPPDDDSVKRNEGSDFVCVAGANRWSAAFQGTWRLTFLSSQSANLSLSGSAPYDNYTQPILASADWFSGLDKVVKGIIIWGGGQEVLIDSIDAIARKLKEIYPNTEYVRSPAGAHVEWLIRKMIGIKGKDESTQAIESWITARL